MLTSADLNKGKYRNPELVPAEVRGKNINAFVLGEQRMEGTSVGPIDAVALVGIPEAQLAAIKHRSTHLNSFFFSLLFFLVACDVLKICTFAVTTTISPS